MLTIKETFQDIAKKRKEKANDYEEIINQMEKRQKKLTNLYEICTSSEFNEVKKEFLEKNPSFENVLTDVNKITSLKEQYKDAITAMTILKDRFSRKNFTIAMVGGTGAGKSRLSRTISGLDNDCIPSLGGKSCTGTQLIIENVESGKPGEFIATIEFKRTSEVLEEINKRYKDICGENQFQSIQCLLDLDNITMDTLKKLASANSTEHLINDFYNDYLEKANRAKWEKYVDTENIERNQDIAQFVSKHNGVHDNMIYFYEHIAVKKVILKTKFVCPQTSEIDGLRIIDTVGFGDKTIDVNKHIQSTMESECDASIILIKSDVRIEFPISLFKNITKAFSYQNNTLIENLGAWTSTIINYRSGDESEKWAEKAKEEFIIGCPSIANSILSKDYNGIIECTDVAKDEANEIIDRFLQHIAKHLKDNDKRIEKNALTLYDTAEHEFSKLIVETENFLIPTEKDNFNNEVKRLRKKMILELDSFKEKVAEKYSISHCLFKMELGKVSEALTDDTLDRVIEATRGNIDASAPDNQYLFGRNILIKQIRDIAANAGKRDNILELQLKNTIADIIEKTFKWDFSADKKYKNVAFIDASDEQYFKRIGENVLTDQYLLSEYFVSLQNLHFDEIKGIIKMVFDSKCNYCKNNLHFDPDKDLKDNLSEFIKQFLEEVKQSEFWDSQHDKAYGIEISEQIINELDYFTSCFEIFYHHEWYEIIKELYEKNCILKDHKSQWLEKISITNKFQETLIGTVYNA